MELWNDFEGKTVDGKFHLEHLIGPKGRSAYFQTKDESGAPATIRLIESLNDEEEILSRWRMVTGLKQEHLLEVLACGQTVLDGTHLVYAVLEPTDMELSDVLRERALTTEETRQVALSVADGLQALHARGLVHQHVESENVLARGETIKLRSDVAREAPEGAEAAALRGRDVRELSLLLSECLTRSQRFGETRLPVPFEEVVRKGESGAWGLGSMLAALQPQGTAAGGRAAAATAAGPVANVTSANVASVDATSVSGASVPVASGATTGRPGARVPSSGVGPTSGVEATSGAERPSTAGSATTSVASADSRRGAAEGVVSPMAAGAGSRPMMGTQAGAASSAQGPGIVTGAARIPEAGAAAAGGTVAGAVGSTAPAAVASRLANQAAGTGDGVGAHLRSPRVPDRIVMEPAQEPKRRGLLIGIVVGVLLLVMAGIHFFRASRSGQTSSVVQDAPTALTSPEQSSENRPPVHDPARAAVAQRVEKPSAATGMAARPGARAPGNGASPTGASITAARQASQAHGTEVVTASSAPSDAVEWRVVAFTYNREAQAAQKAQAIAAKHAAMKPEVFSPNGGSPYLVTLGGWMSVDRAQALKSRARSEGLARDVYAQNYRGKGR